MTQKDLTFEAYRAAINLLAEKLQTTGTHYSGVYGVARGGYFPAIELANRLGIPCVTTLAEGVLVVSDVMASGTTLSQFTQPKATVFCRNSQMAEAMGVIYGQEEKAWINLPDEQGQEIEYHIRKCLEYIGEDPTRDGLIDTPKRIRRMWGEIFRGYDPEQKPQITVFDNGKDGITYNYMVVDSGTFNSMCEHHLMPFWGKYWFAYIPNPKGKVLGLSKIARAVAYCAARAQVQERLVHDVVAMLKEALGRENPPIGMALVMKAHHGCKEFRGVKVAGVMTASKLDGLFMTDSKVREEFMNIVNLSPM